MFELQFITFCAGLPNVSCKKMMRTGSWRIFYKPGYRYASSWDVWNHVKFIYETMMKKQITPDDVQLRVCEKYIEVF